MINKSNINPKTYDNYMSLLYGHLVLVIIALIKSFKKSK